MKTASAVVALLAACFGGLVYAHHCSGYGFWAGSGGAQYVGAYYPDWSVCLQANLARENSFEEWVGKNYRCEGQYENTSGTPKFIGITYCQKTSSGTGFCVWSDFGGQSGHETTVSVEHFCGTCPAGRYFNGNAQCVLGTGNGSNNGKPCDMGEGNPINAKTGNKYQEEVDYAGQGPFPLRFARSYNSFIGYTIGALGPYWRSNYDRELKVNPYGSFGEPPYQWIVGTANVLAVRADGRELSFTASVDASTSYQLPEGTFLSAAPFVTERLQKTATGFRLYGSDDVVEDYSPLGRLLSITDRQGRVQQLEYDADGRLSLVRDPFGKTLTFTYNAQGRLWKMNDPAAGVFEYAYDASARLTTVTYPDAESRGYVYEHPTIAHLLTGIVDENGGRFATFRYGATQARGDLSEHAGGVDRVTLVYNADGTTTVTDAIGTVRTRSFASFFGLQRPTGSTVPCASCGTNSESVTYDPATGFVTSRTDFNDNVTTYVHNARGLEESRTEAANVPDLARTIATTWHPDFRLPTQVDEPGRRTQFEYDASGNRLSETVSDTTRGESRATTWSYDSIGRVLSIDGPRNDVSDVTTYTYYECQTGAECGQVHTITNALGHVTEIASYDLHGNPLAIEDPNGVMTTLTYDSRQRLKTRSSAGATTGFDYHATGQLARVTMPDGSYLAYGYDAAHRLTDIEDSAGNRIHYTLDALGNRTAEEAFDSGDTLKRRQSWVFDALGRLDQIKNAAGEVVTDYTHDDQGNRTSQQDFSAPTTSHTTTFTPDALNRVAQVTNATNGITQYGYNALDQLVSVTDPRNLTTSYAMNALGDVRRQVSPDTGTTLYTFDAGGNRRTQTDARGVTATYSYDALNRLISVDYAGSAEDVRYLYDGSNYAAPMANGIGRLTGIEDGSGVTTLAYDVRGNLTLSERDIGSISFTTSYAYDAADRLSSITYPTGRIVNYARDNIGRISSATTQWGSGTAALAYEIEYLPFGPRSRYEYANGFGGGESWIYDLDYRLVQRGGQGVQRAWTYDMRDNITHVTDFANGARSADYVYDELGQLKEAHSGYGHFGYLYDPNGNRSLESHAISGNYSNTGYTYAEDSNRLLATTGGVGATFDYDTAGNITRKGDLELSYGEAGRLREARRGGSLVGSYAYSASGQRSRKTTYTAAEVGQTLLFHYDPEGRLLAETTETGQLVREYIWLEELPIAMIARPRAAADVEGGVWNDVLGLFGITPPQNPALPQFELFYLHGDQLGTPVAALHHTEQVAWWDGAQEPFGEVYYSNRDDVEQPLRFPGQYFDAETGLHQNWHRDYDPSIGRYLQSDPMGIASGPSTYGYAAQSPLSFIDPTGLFHVGPPLPTANTVICDGKGGFKVQIGGENIRREPCLIECAEAHEKQHIEDLKILAPNVCKGQSYAHTVRPSNAEEKRRLEANGYKAEIECLTKKLSCGDCKEVAQERINQLEGEREQFK